MTIEKLGHAMKWSLVARFAAFMAGFGANVIIPRALGQHDFGVYGEIKTVLMFVLVLVMIGVDASILKFAPMMRVSGGTKAFARTFQRLFLMQIGVWVLILIVSHFGGGLLNSFFRDETGRFSFYVQVAIVCFFFELCMLMTTRLLESWYETKRLAAVVLSGNLLFFALVVIAMRMRFGIVGILFSSAVMNIFMVALLVPQARGLLRCVPSEGRCPGLGVVLRFSLPFVVTGLLNQIVWRQSEVLLLGHFKGAEAAGFFFLAYRTPQMILEFVPATVWPIVLAATSESYTKDATSLPRAITLYYKLIYLLVVPVASMGFAFSRALVPIIYGAKMLPAALFTQLFFVVFSYSFLYTPLSMAFYVMGKSWVNMLIFMVIAVIEISLDLMLIPRYGLWGGMTGVSIALLATVVVFQVVMRRLHPDIKTPIDFLMRCTAAAVPTCLLSILAMRWHSIAALSLMIPAGLALLVVGFRLMKVIGAEEKEMIMRLPIPAKERLLSLF
ncbi:MAG: oligosaccharide flippase family protein [Candidatus Krumholzibacteriaceae bacterium]